MKTKLTLSFLLLLLWTASAFSQGFLVNESMTPAQMPRVTVGSMRRPMPMPVVPPRPVPIQSYKIKELSVEGRIKDQVAEINVSQTFTNTGSTLMEVSFVFPLPYDGAIDQMVLFVDGKEYPAKLLDAAAARKTYEDIVRRNRDPALLEWIGTGMFKTNVFPVPAGASRTVSIRYNQLLRQENGVCDFLFPLSTAKYTMEPVEKFMISLAVETPDELKNIYSPTHEINLKRPDAKRAEISLTETNSIPATDFRLLFDSASGELSTKILGYRPNEKEDGYFLMLVSPKIVTDPAEKPLPKTVLFVLDKSGSMSGDKIVQARDALKFVLNNLNEGDTFNILTYNDRVEMFKPEIQAFTPEVRKPAMDYCDSIRASGSTNIGDALSVSLKMLQDKSQPNYVLFLTDGQPTVGERNEMKLAGIAKTANTTRARIFSFGVGYDLNARLLDRLSQENQGQTEFVLPSENIEERVSRLYSKISSPVLTDVAFEIATKTAAGTNLHGTNQVYPSGKFDLFAGQQLVILGRYSQSGDTTIHVKGKIAEKEQEYQFAGKFDEKSVDSSFSFIERLWAMRRIGEILGILDLQGQNQELLDELVRLSTTHGILTPYTSFLADENTVLTAQESNAVRLGQNVEMLRETSGMSGVAQRGMNAAMKSSLQIAPQQVDRFSAPMDGSRIGQNSRVLAPARPAARSGAGGMGGGIGMRQDSFSAAMPEFGEISDSSQAVQSINNRAFFRKTDGWIDGTLTAEQQKPENVITVKQFSEEYFQLIEKHGKALSQYLVFDEPVLVNFDNQAYHFVP